MDEEEKQNEGVKIDFETMTRKVWMDNKSCWGDAVKIRKVPINTFWTGQEFLPPNVFINF